MGLPSWLLSIWTSKTACITSDSDICKCLSLSLSNLYIFFTLPLLLLFSMTFSWFYYLFQCESLWYFGSFWIQSAWFLIHSWIYLVWFGSIWELAHWPQRPELGRCCPLQVMKAAWPQLTSFWWKPDQREWVRRAVHLCLLHGQQSCFTARKSQWQWMGTLFIESDCWWQSCHLFNREVGWHRIFPSSPLRGGNGKSWHPLKSTWGSFYFYHRSAFYPKLVGKIHPWFFVFVNRNLPPFSHTAPYSSAWGDRFSGVQGEYTGRENKRGAHVSRGDTTYTWFSKLCWDSSQGNIPEFKKTNKAPPPSGRPQPLGAIASTAAPRKSKVKTRGLSILRSALEIPPEVKLLAGSRKPKATSMLQSLVVRYNLHSCRVGGLPHWIHWNERIEGFPKFTHERTGISPVKWVFIFFKSSCKGRRKKQEESLYVFLTTKLFKGVFNFKFYSLPIY